ncbi:MAG: hypothetical protein ACJ77N_10505 [Chloroflexota bacterium]
MAARPNPTGRWFPRPLPSAIGRIDVIEEEPTGTEVSSEDLVEQLADPTDAVISLDGTRLSPEQIAEVRNVLADEVTSEVKLD